MMRLTAFTNFSLRILMYVAMKNDEPASVHDISKAYGVSTNHMKKAASELIKHGYLKTIRGRNGGLLLAQEAQDICIGDVVRVTEDHLNLVECFDPTTNTCPIIEVCQVSKLFKRALNAFMDVLDSATLADMIAQPKDFEIILNINQS
jgi:Rrf2 family nitric oxide-sensitive transcriptional repressor